MISSEGGLSPVVPVVYRRDPPPRVATFIACEGRGREVPVDPPGQLIRRRKRRLKKAYPPGALPLSAPLGPFTP
jgi:hypothetical protein